MDHQSELEKSKYRNWVRGGLAYKYLKDGLEGFADDVVLREHKRILQAINPTPGLTCNQSNLRNLKPLHKSVKDPTGKSRCPWRQNNCNCMHSKKQECPNKVCDAILEEILKSHGSTPPAPNWKNTVAQNWCSSPWEVAKCFINAPGYSDKSSAADIDAPGLLHLFINNTSLHAYISCAITGTDIFSKAVKIRNDIFHSPKMELEKPELNECIDNNVQVLEDDKELKERPEAKQAVAKLKQLKQDNFIITTYNEAEVCRAAMTSITNRSEELKQVIQDAKSDIKLKEGKISKGINEQTQRAIDESLEKLEKHSESMLETMKQTIKLLKERVRQLELDSSEIKQRLTEQK
ncbi:uncharacterized protein CXorf38 homolog isoform X2 [Mercenaria mercenaria]|uniref:uncharacterized protein CXorf38 homolog isoform X2 n=1 Tax=Mercenaria mercenaria TaxID=6596 RepID=UPI00234ECBA5|nr:uncharacterized protein CXorf38 homolog isoform X2 [Mercenaria mercenaria]